MLRDRWKTVRAEIEAEIAEGRWSPGARLPSEAELCARFEVGRHSLRRAIAELAYDGKLSVEQGRGTFVAEAPVLTYRIGKRTRRRENFSAQGVDVSGRLLSSEKTVASRSIAAALELEAGGAVYRQTRITNADRLPIAYGSSWHPLDRFPDFVERREVFGSVTETYRSYGIEDYLRKETTMHARTAREEETRLLKQRPHGPVMVVRAVDTDTEGSPIGTSEVIWSAARVKFIFEPGCGDE
mgnify:CR=1 FL=1